MSTKKHHIATITQLQAIRYKDNGEALVPLDDAGINSVLVRESVAQKLQNAQKHLTVHDPSMQLLVVEGYRTPSYQERYFLRELLFQQQKDTTGDFDLLLEKTHQFVALPTVAGHPTGGAIDLTIVCEGKELDMGGKIADFLSPEKLPTFSPHISFEQTQNRLLLHDLMLKEGFAPFYGEWWHFSYGDPEWSVCYDMAESIYSPVFFDLH
jgi:D-alanyl-D-alanine dipeptidase